MLTRVRLLAAPALAALAGCGHDHDDPVIDPSLADVIYEGGANDEALEALLAAQAVVDPARGATLVSPEQGATVPAAEPAAFSWGEGSAWRTRPRPVERLVGLVGGALVMGHGAPVNGRAYFVVFHTEGDPELTRVFTGLTSYAPATEVWQKMTAAGQPIAVTITSGIYDNNLLAADGGPFVGDTTTFTIAP
jgi:hypothetical protein